MPAARILIVEDEILVARDLEQQLVSLGFTVAGHAARGDDAVRLAEALRPELVLMDIRLQGDSDGIAAAREIGSRLLLPVVFLTAHADDNTLQRAKLAEPLGYILKPFEERELRTVIEMALYKHQAESKLRQSERRYAATLGSIGDAVIAADMHGAITFLNPAAESLTGWSLAEARGRRLNEVVPLHDEKTRQPMWSLDELLSREDPTTGPLGGAILIRDQREIPIDHGISPLKDDTGRTAGLVLVCRDVSERKQGEEERRKLEAQIQQAQKLDSLGVLAGGIAHDFNNLLTSILGYAELAMSELPPESSVHGFVGEAVKAAQRAAELTKQMLAYSGKGRFIVEPLNLSDLIAGMTRLLEVSISKKCVLKYTFSPELPSIEADASQMRQVLMNLVINASEAMGDHGGVVEVTTGVMHCDRAYLSETYLDESLPETQYAYVEVADTGSGMTEDVKSKIFDPFFTTKFTGRGLGLSAVLGIIRGHRGAIKVTSEVGNGTTFQVLFPAVSLAVKAEPDRKPKPRAWHGSGLVLIVDDEESIRGLARHMLETIGFSVLTAADGREAIELFRREADKVRLVLLDMTMPHLDGEETFRELKRIRDDVRTILCSGYSEQVATSRFSGKGPAAFLHKPYRFDQLRALVRKVLEGEGSSDASK